MARNLRIENTAGAASGQAVALMSESDHSVLYRCSLQGYQDTLYARRNNQFYRECHISGTVDFIFGDAAAVFQKCDIVARLPLRGQGNTITAQGRDAANSLGGFVFQFCTATADNDLIQGNFTVNTRISEGPGGFILELCSCSPPCLLLCTPTVGCHGILRCPWTDCITLSSETLALALTSVAGCAGQASTAL